MVIYEDYESPVFDYELYRVYSDRGLDIERDGMRFSEEIIPKDAGYTYTEVSRDEPTTEDYAEAGKILMGVEQ